MQHTPSSHPVRQPLQQRPAWFYGGAPWVAMSYHMWYVLSFITLKRKYLLPVCHDFPCNHLQLPISSCKSSPGEKKQNEAEFRYHSFRKQSNGYERRQKRFEFRSVVSTKKTARTSGRSFQKQNLCKKLNLKVFFEKVWNLMAIGYWWFQLVEGWTNFDGHL